MERKVIIARVAGFCFGVQRAVDMALEARRERYGRLTSLGPIVHNSHVVTLMGKEGVGTAVSLDDIPEGTVIMSAHGVSPDTRAEARARGLEIVDVTCPFVTRAHWAARQLVEEGYQLLIVGDAGHSEVKGIVGTAEAGRRWLRRCARPCTTCGPSTRSVTRRTRFKRLPSS